MNSLKIFLFALFSLNGFFGPTIGIPLGIILSQNSNRVRPKVITSLFLSGFVGIGFSLFVFVKTYPIHEIEREIEVLIYLFLSYGLSAYGGYLYSQHQPFFHRLLSVVLLLAGFVAGSIFFLFLLMYTLSDLNFGT